MGRCRQVLATAGDHVFGMEGGRVQLHKGQHLFDCPMTSMTLTVLQMSLPIPTEWEVA
jgi:hypothetical protein